MHSKFLFIFYLILYLLGCAHKHKPQFELTKNTRDGPVMMNPDIPMLRNAIYVDNTPFYNGERQYYKLSFDEIKLVKDILAGYLTVLNRKPKAGMSPYCIDKYYRQYAAYTCGKKLFVYVNLFAYYYRKIPTDNTLQVFMENPEVNMIILKKYDKNINKFDNFGVLIDLSGGRISKVFVY